MSIVISVPGFPVYVTFADIFWENLNFDKENDVSLKCVDVLENEDDG